MRIDSTSIETEDTQREYIREEGEFTVKVVKVTEGQTSNKNPQIKVHFQDRNGRFAIDEFVLTESALWKLKLLTKALKLPNVINTEMFYERYVKITLKAKQTANGHIYEIKRYDPSNLTNTWEYQAPKAHYEPAPQRGGAGQGELPEYEEVIDQDSIPF